MKKDEIKNALKSKGELLADHLKDYAIAKEAGIAREEYLAFHAKIWAYWQSVDPSIVKKNPVEAV
jgi:hypothetical protein